MNRVTVSAAQAAGLVHRHERRVREWIRIGKLQAKKGLGTWDIELGDLEAIPGITIDQSRLAQLRLEHDRSPAGMESRLASLERELTSVKARLRLLETVGVKSSYEPERSWELAREPAAPALPYEPPQSAYHPPAMETSRQDVPVGSVLLRKFAVAHFVPETTVVSQAKAGRFGVTTLPLGFTGRVQTWITPEQQEEVVMAWRQLSTTYRKCSQCDYGHGALQPVAAGRGGLRRDETELDE